MVAKRHLDRAEDRERFQQMVNKLNLKQPANATVTNVEQALTMAEEIGFPLVVRPSYVLGGRAMEIVYDLKDLKRYLNEAVKVSNDAPVLLDRFLDDAIEVDIDAICDGKDVVIGGIMEHIEQAGVHSGDSACSLPPHSLSKFAIKDGEVYLIEVNPRAARTVPFVSKATGVPLAKVAARVMAGVSLAEQGVTEEVIPPFYSVKEVVLPFAKFQGVDPLLGPEMRSTGEVMGVGDTFEEAYAKANLGAGAPLPKQGKALISVRDNDKPRMIALAKALVEAGFSIEATRGTATELYDAGIMSTVVNKMSEGRPNIVDAIKNGEYAYLINTTEGRQAITDSVYIRREALLNKVTYTTTMNAAFATIRAKSADDRNKVASVQELHARLKH